MFMDIISAHYKEIKTLFKTRSNDFDEDSFNDAFIKCAQRFANEIIDYDVAIKYFWIAYVNTHRANIFKDHNDIKDSLDDDLHDRIDEDETSYAQRIYDIVMDAIAVAFSEDDMMIYSLYKYHGWTEKELIDAGFDCKNLKVRISTIHRFVKAYSKNIERA